ncbi:MAG: pitrilysin family protein [Acidimicrobiales bacterium]
MTDSVPEPVTQVGHLDGGLRVVSQADPAAVSVNVGAWVGVGNRDEPAEIAGVSHFLEHLLFKGSSRRSAARDRRGCRRGRRRSQRLHLEGVHGLPRPRAAKDLDFGLDTLLDVIADPGFSDRDVDSERRVILEELSWSADTPDDLVHQNLGLGLFPDHPLGWEVLGTPTSVRSVQPDDVRAFHDRWYRRANLVISVVGPVDHDEVCERVDAALAGVAAGDRPARVAPTAAPEAEVEVRREIEQAHVALGWRGLHHDDPDRFAMAVANQLVGGGWSSRLFQEIREVRGMSYTVYSAASSYGDAGAWSLYAGTAPDQLDELCGVVDAELADLVENGPSERELDVARGGFEGGTLPRSRTRAAGWPSSPRTFSCVIGWWRSTTTWPTSAPSPPTTSAGCWRVAAGPRTRSLVVPRHDVRRRGHPPQSSIRRHRLRIVPMPSISVVTT